jgi:hypothetical protein
LLWGDIYFRLMHKGSLKSKLICRFALSTAFIIDNRYEFTKKTVDPDATAKDPRFSDEFKIECYFKDYCTKCQPSMPIEELCRRCKLVMQNELPGWEIIRKILDRHPKRTFEDGCVMNFQQKEYKDYVDVIKNKKTDINCEEMQYFQEEPNEEEMSDQESYFEEEK